MGYLEIAGPLNVHNPSHTAERERERERGRERGSKIARVRIIPQPTRESKKSKQWEFVQRLGRRREVTRRRRRGIREERKVRGDECGEGRSVGAEKQMRQRAG